LGAINGRLEFVGTGSAFASYDLIQGINIRDHFDGCCNNIITDPTIVTVDFGHGVRFDRQMFVLPAVFAKQTLTEIRLVGTDADALQGQAFLAAATVQTIPEPSTMFLFISGFGIAALGAWRREPS
jgi:hypothetical protein